MSLTKCEVIEKNRYELQFSVDKETFDKAINVVYRKMVKNINIPGFRKGKAPKAIIEKMYGKGVFYEDAINDLLPEAFSAALEESKIDAVGTPEFDIVSVDDNGLVMSAKVYVKPDVTVANYAGLEVEKNVEKVTDEEVENEINMIRERNSREIEITDRAAENGDNVIIDYAGSVDGVAFDGGTAEKQNLLLGSGQFIPGFEDQIVGKNIGDEFDVNVTFPTEYHAAELAGKAAVFKVKLHSINKIELPELDDDFAKDVSEFDTFAEYEADVKAKIEKRHETAAENKVEEDLMNKLIEALEDEIPETMFDAEVENCVRDYDNRLRMNGLDLQTYFKYTGLTLETLRTQMRPDAERQVKVRLALEKIASLEKLEATEEDITAEYSRLAEMYGMELDKIKEAVAEDAVAEDIKVKKAIDLVREKAVITEVEDKHDAE
ncbi:MAG: trigger factor [Clostridia bacterium]|nr:trigger factor [Clostridia bacterium]